MTGQHSPSVSCGTGSPSVSLPVPHSPRLALLGTALPSLTSPQPRHSFCQDESNTSAELLPQDTAQSRRESPDISRQAGVRAVKPLCPAPWEYGCRVLQCKSPLPVEAAGQDDAKTKVFSVSQTIKLCLNIYLKSDSSLLPWHTASKPILPSTKAKRGGRGVLPRPFGGDTLRVLPTEPRQLPRQMLQPGSRLAVPPCSVSTEGQRQSRM